MTATLLNFRRWIYKLRYMGAVILAGSLWTSAIHAGTIDVVEMQNGDRYAGKILSMDATQLVIQSEVLGKLNLPREKVANIRLASTPAAVAVKLESSATNSAATTPVASKAIVVTNGSADLAGAFRAFGTNEGALKSIRQQYLLDAGPEANAKFDELLGGVMSGKVSINDLRGQAKSAADQLRSLKRELGSDAGSEVDGYLAILDHFLKETSTVTNSPAAPRKTAASRDE